MDSRGRWRIVARSTEQLAKILEVSPTAITKAERLGRIARELDGAWDVLAVVQAWRAGVHRYMQRDPSPWVDPGEELNVTMLIRRARYAGGQVQFRPDGEDEWQDHRDPVARVNGGESFDPETSADDYLAVSELNGLAPGAGYWLDVPEMTAPIVATLAGVAQKKARAALDAAVRVALLWQIAAAEEEGLGPADTSSIAHGRIPLVHLAKRETAGRGPRAPASPR